MDGGAAPWWKRKTSLRASSVGGESYAPSSSATPESLATAPIMVCALSGHRLFSCAHPFEVCEDGSAYRVRGDMDEGLMRHAMQIASARSSTSSWPASTIDVVHWAGLKQADLDRAGFIRRWRDHVHALAQRLADTPRADGGGRNAADEFLVESHDIATRLLPQLDELDFVIGASERADGPLGVVHYRDDDPLVPRLLFLKAGCRLERPTPAVVPAAQSETDPPAATAPLGSGSSEPAASAAYVSLEYTNTASMAAKRCQ